MGVWLLDLGITSTLIYACTHIPIYSTAITTHMKINLNSALRKLGPNSTSVSAGSKSKAKKSRFAPATKAAKRLTKKSATPKSGKKSTAKKKKVVSTKVKLAPKKAAKKKQAPKKNMVSHVAGGKTGKPKTKGTTTARKSKPESSGTELKKDANGKTWWERKSLESKKKYLEQYPGSKMAATVRDELKKKKIEGTLTEEDRELLQAQPDEGHLPEPETEQPPEVDPNADPAANDPAVDPNADPAANDPAVNPDPDTGRDAANDPDSGQHAANDEQMENPTPKQTGILRNLVKFGKDRIIAKINDPDSIANTLSKARKGEPMDEHDWHKTKKALVVVGGALLGAMAIAGLFFFAPAALPDFVNNFMSDRENGLGLDQDEGNWAGSSGGPVQELPMFRTSLSKSSSAVIGKYLDDMTHYMQHTDLTKLKRTAKK